MFAHETVDGHSLIQAYCTQPGCRYQRNGWMICSECILCNPCPQRFRFIKKEQIQQHIQSHEEFRCCQITDSEEETKDGGFSDEFVAMEEDLLSEMVKDNMMKYVLQSPSDSPVNKSGSLSKNYKCFYEHMANSKAMRFIVAKSYTKNNSSAGMISEQDAEIHLLIASISFILGQKNNTKLARLFELINNNSNSKLICVEKERDAVKRELEKLKKKYKVKPDTSTNKSSLVTQEMEEKLYTISYPLPTEPNMLRRYADGSKSIIANLPIPRIQKGPGTSAFVLLSDALRCYLPYGLELDSKEKLPTNQPSVVRTYWDSEAAREGFSKLPESTTPTQKVLITEWSDGMDPNGKKTNRGSAHAITMSLLDSKKGTTRIIPLFLLLVKTRRTMKL